MTDQQTCCPLARHASEQPEVIALVQRQPQGPARRCSYLQLHLQVEQRCNWLQQQGVRPGQQLLVALDDPAELLRLLVAVLRLSCVLIPINPAFPARQQRALLHSCDADWFIAATVNTAPQRPGASLDSAPLPQRCRRLELPAILNSVTASAPAHPIPINNPHAPLSGVLTSGSTGAPKLALHSFANHAASAEGSRSLIPLQSGDGWAVTLPLYHIGGQALLFRALLAGASLIIPAPAEALSQLLEEPRLTHLSAVATQLLRLQQQQFDFSGSSLRQLLLGGSAIPPSLLAWLAEQPLQCWISYGLTEMSSQVMTGPLCSSGRLARLLPHCQLQLADNQEIRVKGASLFLGYYRNGHCYRPVDEHGWFHTRDLGQLDPQQGLTISGRLDNQFISGGENIQPELIERALSAYPGLTACYVVPINDADYGQRPVAFISPHAAIDPQALSHWLRQRLPSYLVPIHYLPLPLSTATLKSSRPELGRLAAELLDPAPAPE